MEKKEQTRRRVSRRNASGMKSQLLKLVSPSELSSMLANLCYANLMYYFRSC